MFDNLFIPNQLLTNNLALKELSFQDYIFYTRKLITTQRILPLNLEGKQAEDILNANLPYELFPDNLSDKYQKGALLIHGLLDSPFSLKDIGLQLKTNNIMCRSVLLPGHGVDPSNLLHVTYQDWIEVVRYGIEVMHKDVEELFLIGYSTGAALSLYHALEPKQREKIAGLILLAPAIRIKAPVKIVIGWHHLTKWLKTNNPQWLYREKEMDHAKYRSITFNAVHQITQLTDAVANLHQHSLLNVPTLMVVSDDDETISSQKAKRFFASLTHPDNQLLLYSREPHRYADKKIDLRASSFPALNIQNFSHVSIPFSANNPHYGQQGDYVRASRVDKTERLYGAYNRLEERFYNRLYQLKLVKYSRHELTYNPDFDYMVDKIVRFIKK